MKTRIMDSKEVATIDGRIVRLRYFTATPQVAWIRGVSLFLANNGITPDDILLWTYDGPGDLMATTRSDGYKLDDMWLEISLDTGIGTI